MSRLSSLWSRRRPVWPSERAAVRHNLSLMPAGGPVEHPVPPSHAGVDSRTAGSTQPRGRNTP